MNYLLFFLTQILFSNKILNGICFQMKYWIDDDKTLSIVIGWWHFIYIYFSAPTIYALAAFGFSTKIIKKCGIINLRN